MFYLVFFTIENKIIEIDFIKVNQETDASSELMGKELNKWKTIFAKRNNKNPEAVKVIARCLNNEIKNLLEENEIQNLIRDPALSQIIEVIKGGEK